jgi:hypothetical protein
MEGNSPNTVYQYNRKFQLDEKSEGSSTAADWEAPQIEILLRADSGFTNGPFKRRRPVDSNHSCDRERAAGLGPKRPLPSASLEVVCQALQKPAPVERGP